MFGFVLHGMLQGYTNLLESFWCIHAYAWSSHLFSAHNFSPKSATWQILAAPFEMLLISGASTTPWKSMIWEASWVKPLLLGTSAFEDSYFFWYFKGNLKYHPNIHEIIHII